MKATEKWQEGLPQMDNDDTEQQLWPLPPEVLAYYARGCEAARLSTGTGRSSGRAARCCCVISHLRRP